LLGAAGSPFLVAVRPLARFLVARAPTHRRSWGVNLDDTALGVRWSIGDVSDDGFEALQMSVWGARRLFGPRTAYEICVNTLSVAEARAKTGVVPDEVRWRHVERELPPWLVARIGTESDARDVGWKLVPLRLFPDRFELSIDNDCILWDMPVTLAAWLTDNHPTRCLLAEDVRLCSGRFAADHPEPRNTCIRGLPPGFDLGAALAEELDRVPGHLVSELDELGLQIAALTRDEPPCVVPVADVTICSPFPPHHLALGRCGAHFVGINAKQLDRPGRDKKDDASHDDNSTENFREHWRRHRQRLFELVGLAPPAVGDGRMHRSVPDTSYGA
jgi:hypothetical protein